MRVKRGEHSCSPKMRQEPGQGVVSHGVDRDLTVEELSG